jgi:hypothetical protein
MAGAASYSRLLLPLLLANGVWHSLACFYFVVWGDFTLRTHFRLSHQINELVLWVMQFLGAINVGFAVLAFAAGHRLWGVQQYQKQARAVAPSVNQASVAHSALLGFGARSTDLIVLAVVSALRRFASAASTVRAQFDPFVACRPMVRRPCLTFLSSPPLWLTPPF